MYTERAGIARLPRPPDTDWTPNYWRPDRPDDWRPPSGVAWFQTTGSYAPPAQPPRTRASKPRRINPAMTPMKVLKACAVERQQLALRHLREHGGSMRVARLRELTGWDPFQASQLGKALVDKKQIFRKHGYWVLCQPDKNGQPVILDTAPSMPARRNAILYHLRANYPKPLTAGTLAELIGFTVQQIRNAGRSLATDHLISRGMGQWRAIHPTETRKHD